MDGMNRPIMWAAGAALGFLAVRRLARRRYTFRDRVCVITGGSRGLGLVMARQLATEGARVVLLARDPAELHRAMAHLANGDHHTIACDVTDPSSVRHAIEQVGRIYGRIDVLINNAGVIQVGPLEHMTVSDFDDAIGTHMMGPLYTTMAALPLMRSQGEGRIVNIASVAGKVAFPHLLPYVASKHGLVGLSRGFRHELSRHGIAVTTVCPGLIRTGSARNAMFKGRHRQEYTWFAISDSLPVLSMNAERTGRKILNACRVGAAQVSISVKARIAAVADALFPEMMSASLSGVARLLPGSVKGKNGVRHPGSESHSPLAPSFLTALGDRAAARNNE